MIAQGADSSQSRSCKIKKAFAMSCYLPVKSAPFVLLLACFPPTPHSSDARLYDSTMGLRNACKNTMKQEARHARGPNKVLLTKTQHQPAIKATAKVSTTFRRRSLAVCPKCAKYLSLVGRRGTTRLSVRRGSRSSLHVGTCRRIFVVPVVVRVVNACRRT